MSSRILTVTLQAAAISALSNTLAQGLVYYRTQRFSSIDPIAFFHFVLLAIITTPPNYQWQMVLEKNFPSTKQNDASRGKKNEKKSDLQEPKEEGGTQLSFANTVMKFVLDQSIGSILNTAFFIVMINLLRGAGPSQILTVLQRDFVPFLLAGYKFWPFVTLTNLILVPVEQRMLVGNLAGLIWGVLVSLMGI